MEYKHGDTILGESRVSDLQGLKERLRSMPPEAILAELDRWVQAEEQAGREPDADVISACYEVLDEVDPVPVPDRAYETSRALFAQEHPEYMEPAPAAPPGGKRRFRPRGRRLSLAAAIALLIVGGTVAFAFELPQRLLVSMGFETFLVRSANDDMQLEIPTEDGYFTLEDALQDYGIQTYTPTWLPEGLKLTDVSIVPGDKWDTFIALYQPATADQKAAFIKVTAYDFAQDMPVSIYEDNGNRATISSSNPPIDFIVTSNIDETRISWQTGSCVSSILGTFSDSDIQNIISSMKLGESE